MRPWLGLSPTRPQHDAGMRIDPPPSLAWANGTIPDATAAAAPAGSIRPACASRPTGCASAQPTLCPMATQEADDHLAAATAVLARIADNVERVIRGKRDVIELVLLCLVAEGHLLVEDVPGVGKTSLAKALARSLDVSFGRIQFTPGPPALRRRRRLRVQPRDAASSASVPARSSRAWCWPTRSTGPRPKTQSALLEAMAEEQVTVDGVTYPLHRPFVVIATQNPIEHEGTYALPESQLDRFLMRVGDRLPVARGRARPARAPGRRARARRPAPGGRRRRPRRPGQGRRRRSTSAPALRRYLVDLADASRRHPDLGLGMSPRATLSLLRVSRVRALAAGRAFATPDDVKALVRPGPRPPPHHQRRRPPPRGVATEDVLGELIDTVPVPRAPLRLLTRAGWGVLLAGGVALLGGWLFGLPELLILGTAPRRAPRRRRGHDAADLAAPRGRAHACTPTGSTPGGQPGRRAGPQPRPAPHARC